MMASQFCRSAESCHRNVTGCLATCWIVQYASWSQFDPGKMMTPNFISRFLLEILLKFSTQEKAACIGDIAGGRASCNLERLGFGTRPGIVWWHCHGAGASWR